MSRAELSMLLLVLCSLSTAACSGGGGGSANLSDDRATLPPGAVDAPDLRINSLQIGDWYTTLTTQPEVDISGEVATWAWDFGEGAIPATSMEPQPTITLQAPGEYSGALTVTDRAGRVARVPLSYRVLPPAVPRVDLVTPAGEAGGEFTAATFAVATSGPPVTSWSWDFGDGAHPAQSTEASPRVELQGIGGYVGSVEVCGPFGCSERSFEFSVRIPQLAWTSHALPTTSLYGTVIAGQTGLPWVVFTMGPKLQLAELVNEADDTWQIHDLVGLDEGDVGMLAVERSEQAAHILLSIGASEPVQYVQVDAESFDVRMIPLTETRSIYDYYASSAALASIAADDQQVHVVLARRDGSAFRPALLKIDPLSLNVGAPRFLTNGFRHGTTPVSLRAVDLMLLDDSLFLAQVSNIGSQVVEPGTLSVARESASGDWIAVDIDTAARACQSINWVPTTSGMHLIDGACHDTRRVPSGDPGFYHSEGSDHGLREAWSPVREFTAASDWQTGRSAVLPQDALTALTSVRNRPVLATSGGGPSIDVVVGSNASPGGIPWTVRTFSIGTLALGDCSIASAPDSAWVLALDYREWIPCYSGHTDCSGYFGDPVLVLGKVSFE